MVNKGNFVKRFPLTLITPYHPLFPFITLACRRHFQCRYCIIQSVSCILNPVSRIILHRVSCIMHQRRSGRPPHILTDYSGWRNQAILTTTILFFMSSKLDHDRPDPSLFSPIIAGDNGKWLKLGSQWTCHHKVQQDCIFGISPIGEIPK